MQIKNIYIYFFIFIKGIFTIVIKFSVYVIKLLALTNLCKYKKTVFFKCVFNITCVHIYFGWIHLMCLLIRCEIPQGSIY